MLILVTDGWMDAHIKHHTATSSLQEILRRPNTEEQTTDA